MVAIKMIYALIASITSKQKLPENADGEKHRNFYELQIKFVAYMKMYSLGKVQGWALSEGLSNVGMPLVGSH